MKRVLALCLTLLCLTSCASMLEREYTVAEPHEENRPPQSDAYRAETYPALRAGLLSYVEEGMESGVLRVPATYSGNLTVDLEKAKRQLMEEEPLGCYALSDITFHTSKIIAYYEVTAAFDYRVEPEAVKRVAAVRDDEALDAAVKAALGDFQERFAVLLNIPGQETETELIGASLRRVYDANAGLALGYPEMMLTYYPETGARRVTEVTLTYPESADALRRRQREMRQAAREIVEGLEPGADAFAVRAALDAHCAYDEQGGVTAADALLDGAANDEGLARAFDLLCSLQNLPTGAVEYAPDGNGWRCTVEQGDRAVIMGFLPGGV